MSVEQDTALIPATGDHYKGRKAAGYRIVVECDGLEQGLTEGDSEFLKGFQMHSTDNLEARLKAVNTGTIVSVGEQAYKSAHLGGSAWAKEGDRIRFQQYGGDMYTEGGIYYRIINDEDVWEILL